MERFTERFENMVFGGENARCYTDLYGNLYGAHFSKSSNPVKGTVGSNPTASATSEQAISSLLRFFFGKIGAYPRRCSSFSAKGHVRAACCCVRPLGASALTTARCRRQILAGASTARGISFMQAAPRLPLRRGGRTCKTALAVLLHTFFLSEL